MTIHPIVDDEVPSVVYMVGGVTVGSIGGGNLVTAMIWVGDGTAEGLRFHHLFTCGGCTRVPCSARASACYQRIDRCTGMVVNMNSVNSLITTPCIGRAAFMFDYGSIAEDTAMVLDIECSKRAMEMAYLSDLCQVT